MRVSIISTSPIQVRKNQLRSGEYSMPVKGQNLQANLTFKGEKWPDIDNIGNTLFIKRNPEIYDKEVSQRNSALKFLKLNENATEEEISEVLNNFLSKKQLDYLVEKTKLNPDESEQSVKRKISKLSYEFFDQEMMKKYGFKTKEELEKLKLNIIVNELKNQGRLKQNESFESFDSLDNYFFAKNGPNNLKDDIPYPTVDSKYKEYSNSIKKVFKNLLEEADNAARDILLKVMGISETDPPKLFMRRFQVEDMIIHPPKYYNIISNVLKHIT